MSTFSAPPETPATALAPANSAIAAAVREGLTAPRKSLPAWLFYDAEGSRLFEQITLLPEYYLTRTERAIFQAEADRIIAAAFQSWHQATGDGQPTPDGAGRLRLLELGAGTATKTGILLAAAVRAQGETEYLPIDVSESAIAEACLTLTETLPQVNLQPQVANYVTDDLAIALHDGPTLALYIGSSIGNFGHDEAVAILRNLRAQLRPGDTLLLGTDLVKDTAILEAAYCDADRVTEAFNLNMLRRLNRELGAGFDLSTFRHVARYNREASRIEMHLRSTRTQQVSIPSLNLSIPFQAGESIHTENSYKFTPDSIRHLLREGGFAVTHTYTDPQNYFAVTLATVAA
ncbi:L-histidine N(alpha)-methyltransferase [Terriglobus aquaticus]|uniref:L-histidine N(Alpha)-methyltransferase n=1 Tax=Terriglobus aquaticus TaxID=940139 RepID=A0ABW9KIC6_9BACT|nr:L-histidine N(alpha)-methyltransferase [Terriglobus aquaticus]